MDWKKKGFSLAEALITLMIVSLILAAVMPVVAKRKNTSDSMWHYVMTGSGANSDIFYGMGTSQTAILGDNQAPTDSKGSRLIVVTPAKPATGDDTTIQRSLIDFYQKTPTGPQNIGRIAFDNPKQYPNGGFNTAVGASALQVNTTGNTNTAIGSTSLLFNTTGCRNTAVGHSSLSSLSTGSFNTAVGSNSLDNVDFEINGLKQTGSYNTAVGSWMMRHNTTGYSNSAIGSQALYSNTTGYENTAVGVSSLYNNTTGYWNVAIGSGSLSSSKTGISNVAIGINSLRGNDSGSSNTAIGFQSMWTNTSGNNNVAVGTNALFTNNGEQNVAVGINALKLNTTGFHNTAVGSNDLMALTTGDNNTALGEYSMPLNSTGGSNSVVGDGSLFDLVGGSKNISIGTTSCRGVVNGSGNVCLGFSAGPGSDVNNRLYIDNTQQGDNSLILGDFAARWVKISGTLYTPTGGVSTWSDRRVKNIKGDYNAGLENILRLNVKQYTYKTGPNKRLHTGVIAQDLQKIIPTAVISGPGNEKFKSLLYVDTNEILFSLVNSVKQLYSKLVATNTRVSLLNKKLSSQNELQQKQIAILKGQNESLNRRLKRLETDRL